MSCHQCQKIVCSCSELHLHKAQKVVSHQVVLRCRMIFRSDCLQREDDVVEVTASGVTVTLPCDPLPCRSYRILATEGDVTVVDAGGEFVATVPGGSSLDLTFSSSADRWIPACCGDVDDLASLIGPQGVAGLVGAIGADGVAGLIGAIGIAGVAGLTGAIGVQGVAGLVGVMGPQGIAGIVGPQGIQGVPGVAGLSEFAYIYNLTSRVVPIEGDVLLDLNGPITAGITHTPGSALVNIVNAGTYEINFSVSGVEPNQFALTVNGVPEPSTVYGSGAGTQQTTGHAILTLGSGSVLTLRNHSSAAAVTLQPNAGGTQENVNASLTIKKLSP